MNLPNPRAVAEELRGSLWFVPTVSVVVWVVLALVLIRVEVPQRSFLADVIFSGGADGARGMLQAVAGSVITVTGLTFSLTVVTLQLASSQFSPRLLRTFLRDTGNQVVLAVFISTFAYCLTVLRTIRAGEGGADEFVPQLAVSVGFLLALASVGALVYFIDHITTEIRVDTMLRNVELDTRRLIDRLHPHDHDDHGDRHEAEALSWDRPPDHAVAVRATRSGFLTSVSARPLLRLASEHALIVELEPKVGDPVVEGAPLAWCWPSEAVSNRRVDPQALQADVHAALTIGAERTLQEDVAYGLRQLVDVAVKALSPGVNDPTTATHATGRLAPLLRALAERPPGPLVWRDEEQTTRLVVRRPGFEALLRDVCGQIRRYGAGEPTVMEALLNLLRDAGDGARDAARRQAVLVEIDLVERAASRSVDEPTDLERVTASAGAARRAVEGDRRPGPR
ncbi:MAG: DUF2254 domain-containing protein [Euzebyales bacterium]|nr:DUF2254 domain-containing protein [Euzebyales bacterium]